ncbi:hypothetical protein L1887_59508 [Cichorium endivia]|nr:hypothetical protein L1887_59508 [Cichorium endivia]
MPANRRTTCASREGPVADDGYQWESVETMRCGSEERLHLPTSGIYKRVEMTHTSEVASQGGQIPFPNPRAPCCDRKPLSASSSSKRSLSFLPHPPSPIRDSVKQDPPAHPIRPRSIDPPDSPTIQPRSQVLALRHVELLQVATAFNNTLNTVARDSDAPADGEIAQLEQVEAHAAHTVVGDGASTECHVKAMEVRQAERKHFGGSVGQRAAEGEVELVQAAAATDDADDRLVGKVRAVGEDQAAEVLELVDAPAVEASVGDGCAARQVEALQAVGGAVGDVCHAAVLDVLTIAKREPFELWSADDTARSRRRFTLQDSFDRCARCVCRGAVCRWSEAAVEASAVGSPLGRPNRPHGRGDYPRLCDSC